VHSALAASLMLTVKILKTTKEKHFRLSHQKHVKTHVNRKNSFGTQRNPRQGRRGKIHVVPHTSFPGDATACSRTNNAKAGTENVDFKKILF